MTGLVAMGVGLAVAGDPDALSLRRQGDAAFAEQHFEDALSAYQACAAIPGEGRDARYCESRRAELAPQREDDFAGWQVLDRVRRGYVELGTEAATLAIEAALAANPQGPAAAAQRRWLANESLKAGKEPRGYGADRSGGDSAWLDEQVARLRQARRHRVFASVGAVLTSLYAGAVWRGSGPWAWRSAAVAAGALGAAPLLAAVAWDAELAGPFAWNAAFCALAVLGAPRAPVAVAVAGTLGGLVALGWWHGWLGKMGIP